MAESMPPVLPPGQTPESNPESTPEPRPGQPAEPLQESAPAEVQVPEAVVRTRRRWPTLVIWAFPIVAILFGGWLAIQALRERGPMITIAFKSGEGIEARKTKIKFKNVDIGEVRAVTLSEDRQRVNVTAQLS